MILWQEKGNQIDMCKVLTTVIGKRSKRSNSNAKRRRLRREPTTGTATPTLTMDPLSPAITFFDKEGKGRTSYIGSLVPDKLFYPTPGLWFTQQDDKVTADISTKAFTNQRDARL